MLPLVVTAALVFFFVKAGRRLLPRAYDKESPMYLGNIVGIVSLTEVAYFGYLLPNLYDQWILWHLAAVRGGREGGREVEGREGVLTVAV